MNILDMLKNAAIVDTETLSLRRGAVHELSVYDFNSKTVLEYILDPHLVEVAPATAQDAAKLVSSSADAIRFSNVGSWPQAIAKQILLEHGVDIPDIATRVELEQYNKFLYEAVKSGKYPHLTQPPGSPLVQDTVRTAQFASEGTVLKTERTSVQKLLGGQLQTALEGRTVWLANAAFDAKQLGALGTAVVAEGGKVPLSQFETRNPAGSEFLYVTGKEVNRQRALAAQTGDWTKVWKAYKATTVKPGTTAVRDIQDVLRAMMSYGQQLGMTQKTSSYFGTSMDLTYRLFGLTESDPEVARQIFGTKEVHRSAEDVSRTSRYVLEKALGYTQVLQDVAERTPEGLRYLEEAARGTGPLVEVGNHLSRLERVSPQLMQQYAAQRLGRAYEDIAKEGVSTQVTGISRIMAMEQVDPQGLRQQVHRPVYSRAVFESVDEVSEYMVKNQLYGQFGVDVGAMRAEMDVAARAAGTAPSEQLQGVQRWVQTHVGVASDLGEFDVLRNIMGAGGRAGKQSARMAQRSSISQALGTVAQNVKLSKMKIAGGVGIGVFLAASAIMPEQQSIKPLTAYGYEDWRSRNPVALQGEPGGPPAPAIEGLSEYGENKRLRGHNTDFGSPYKGPSTSQSILANQELLREREKWMRQQYGVTYYDPVSGLFGLNSVFNIQKYSTSSVSSTRLAPGRDVESGYMGLKGGSLKAINLDEGWKIQADDADTITIKRGGVGGALKSFFGLNTSYTFRMGGIDAPEIAHDGRPAQPYAYEAADMFKNMIKESKHLEVVFNTKDVTYGRAVGVLMDEQRNLNMELVKQGAVAYLPFGKAKNSLIDYNTLGKYEQQAYDANRGMWSQPWAQGFRAFSNTYGQRLTFNSLAQPERVAQNMGMMELVTMMDAAQEHGSVQPYAQALANLGSNFDDSRDSMRPVISDTMRTRARPADRYMVDLQRYIATHGTGRDRGFGTDEYVDLNKRLVQDSMGATSNIGRRRTPQIVTHTNSPLKSRMASEQRRINKRVFDSPINHHQM